jgi:hypothetical protein
VADGKETSGQRLSEDRPKNNAWICSRRGWQCRTIRLKRYTAPGFTGITKAIAAVNPTKLRRALKQGGRVFGCMLSQMAATRFGPVLEGSTLDYAVIDI